MICLLRVGQSAQGGCNGTLQEAAGGYVKAVYFEVYTQRNVLHKPSPAEFSPLRITHTGTRYCSVERGLWRAPQKAEMATLPLRLDLPRTRPRRRRDRSHLFGSRSEFGPSYQWRQQQDARSVCLATPTTIRQEIGRGEGSMVPARAVQSYLGILCIAKNCFDLRCVHA